jgi:predicted lipoprotein
MQGVLSSSNVINQPFLEEQGCVVKGLFAVEYLLFESGSQTNSTGKTPLIMEGLASPGAGKYRQFLLTLTQEISTRATLVAGDWTAPGITGPGERFATGGQQSVNLLVNQLAAAIENAAERHLHFVLVLPNPISRQLYRVERSRSGSSLEGLLAYVEGAQKFFSGNGGLGLKDAVRQVNPALEKRIAEQFEASLGAIRAINAPLEQAAVNNRAAIENAYEKNRALEILLKVDMVSALGVTLSFSSNDGD